MHRTTQGSRRSKYASMHAKMALNELAALLQIFGCNTRKSCMTVKCQSGGTVVVFGLLPTPAKPWQRMQC